ncbi:MAG: rhodanese-like domain-containing protein [Ignavibacteria bacterium]|nr:rhodanese-like domain-containing protein [Ignavibacteria bacterium]
MNNKIILAAAAAAVLIFVYMFFFNGAKTTAEDVTPEKFSEFTKEPDAVILDVRSAFEFGGDKIAGAQNMSYTSSGFKAYLEKLDKSKSYLVYCASGSRSVGAVKQMKSMGFEKVYNLKGGIEHWKSAGMPVVR